MRILLAEDDLDLNAALKTLLTRSGYQVDAVTNGEYALDYAQAEAYDGMILDWMMPGLDGVEALRRIREAGVHVPCLLLTARDAVEDSLNPAPSVHAPGQRCQVYACRGTHSAAGQEGRKVCGADGGQ